MGGDSEPALVRLAQLGDLVAFESLLKRIHAPMRAYLSGLVGGESCEDALQELSLQIFREVRWLREPKAFRAWVYRIATRIAFRHLRRERRWRSFERDPEILEAVPEPERALPGELESSFLELINRVSPASRAVLLLHYQQELSLHEVAAVLDIPLGTVKSRLAYGVSTLRDVLKGSKYAS